MRFALFVGLALSAMLPDSLFLRAERCEATMYGRVPTLREFVHGSRYVLAGTVTRTDTAPDSATGTIVTRVTFRQLAFAKGSADGDSLVLRNYGGEYQGSSFEMVGQTHFERGQRYICFVRGGLGTARDGFPTILDGALGVLRVLKDPRTHRSMVATHSGHFVTAVDTAGVSLIAPLNRTPDLVDAGFADSILAMRSGRPSGESSGVLTESEMLSGLRRVMAAFAEERPRVR